MSWLWKIVLSLYNLALISLGAVMISLASGNSAILDNINVWMVNPWDRIWAGAVGGLLIVLGFMLLIMSLKKETGETVLVRDAAGGQIFITITAVEQIVLKTVRTLTGVRESRPVIKSTRPGLKIYLHLLLVPDTVVPELTAELQQLVKAEVERLVGVPVLEVKVLVDDSAYQREQR